MYFEFSNELYTLIRLKRYEGMIYAKNGLANNSVVLINPSR